MILEDIPNLVGLWYFKEPKWPYISIAGDRQYDLIPEFGAAGITSITGGQFGHGVRFAAGSNLMVPRAKIGKLDPGRASGSCTIIAYGKRLDNIPNSQNGQWCVAGVWDEGDAQRVASLWHDLDAVSGGSKVCGHVSRSGGATPTWGWSIDLAATLRKTDMKTVRMMGMSYGGNYARAYLDGETDKNPNVKTCSLSNPNKCVTRNLNPFYYPGPLYQQSWAPYRVNAADAPRASRNCEIYLLAHINRRMSNTEIREFHRTVKAKYNLTV